MMDPAHKAALRKLRVELSDQLLISDTIVPFLYQEDVLTEEHLELIDSQVTNRQKNLKLLDLLPNRGPRAFDTFLRSLRDFNWLRERLLLEVQELQAAPGSDAQIASEPRQLPDSALQRVPSDWELQRLVSRLSAEWEVVLVDLGLPTEALHRCRCDHSLNTQAAALAGFVQWRRSEGRKATVGRLLRSLHAAGVHPSVLTDAIS